LVSGGGVLAKAAEAANTNKTGSAQRSRRRATVGLLKEGCMEVLY
jgi:hypothetical protein